MVTPDFADTRTLLDQLRTEGRTFFDSAMHLDDDSGSFFGLDADHYWSQIDNTLHETSIRLQSD